MKLPTKLLHEWYTEHETRVQGLAKIPVKIIRRANHHTRIKTELIFTAVCTYTYIILSRLSY